jgi:hypothetical protein
MGSMSSRTKKEVFSQEMLEMVKTRIEERYPTQRKTLFFSFN